MQKNLTMRSFIIYIFCQYIIKTVYVARAGELRNAHKILIGKHEGEKPFGTPRRW